MSTTKLPPELQRAEFIADRLARSIATAKRVRHTHVALRLEHAEDLLQLLEDSLKTAKLMLRQSGVPIVRNPDG